MIKLFLSHSSKDVEIAELLIELIRSALNLKRHEIRCSSVNEYGLSIGAVIDENIRQEICKATIFICLLSQLSLRSTYVLLEIGARWGVKKGIIPLLMPDISPNDLKPPISRFNAQYCDKASSLHQLIDELAKSLNLRIVNPAVCKGNIQKIIEASKKPLLILQPSNGDTVSLRPIIDGKVRDSNSDVWLIVRPMDSASYWIQPKAEVKSTGKWTAQIYIGREGKIDIGTCYEVRAVANPKVSVKEGEVLNSWPLAEYESDVIKLIRR